MAKQEEIPQHQGLDYQSNKASTNRVEVFNAADLEIDYDYYLDQEGKFSCQIPHIHNCLENKFNKSLKYENENMNLGNISITFADAIEDEAYLKTRNMKKLAQELKEEEELKPIVEDAGLKLSEMAQLFGESGAHEILSLETEMQMNFEKLRDQKDAQLWPCLPLNMKFWT